jgi:hypothetical protein
MNKKQFMKKRMFVVIVDVGAVAGIAAYPPLVFIWALLASLLFAVFPISPFLYLPFLLVVYLIIITASTALIMWLPRRYN